MVPQSLGTFILQGLEAEALPTALSSLSQESSALRLLVVMIFHDLQANGIKVSHGLLVTMIQAFHVPEC